MYVVLSCSVCGILLQQQNLLSAMVISAWYILATQYMFGWTDEHEGIYC